MGVGYGSVMEGRKRRKPAARCESHLVDAVNVAKGGSDSEHGADGGELLVALPDVLGLNWGKKGRCGKEQSG